MTITSTTSSAAASYAASSTGGDYSDAVQFGTDTYSKASGNQSHAGEIIATAIGSVVLPVIGSYLGNRLGAYIDNLLGDLNEYAQHVKQGFAAFSAIYQPEFKWYVSAQATLQDTLAKMSADERAIFAQVANQVAGDPPAWTGQSGHKNSQSGPWFVPAGGPSGSKLLGYLPGGYGIPSVPPLLANDGQGEQTLDPACLGKEGITLADCVITGEQTVGLMGPMVLEYLGADANYRTSADHWDPASAMANGQDVANKIGASIAGGLKAVEQSRSGSGSGSGGIGLGTVAVVGLGAAAVVGAVHYGGVGGLLSALGKAVKRL
jgi:hypothetical protein